MKWIVHEDDLYKYYNQFEFVEIRKAGERMDLAMPKCYTNGELIPFTELFKGIEVPILCEEQHVFGKTYYSLYMDEKGNFTDLKILKEVGICIRNSKGTIEKVVQNADVLSNDYHGTEIIFSQKIDRRKLN